MTRVVLQFLTVVDVLRRQVVYIGGEADAFGHTRLIGLIVDSKEFLVGLQSVIIDVCNHSLLPEVVRFDLGRCLVRLIKRVQGPGGALVSFL